LGGKNLVAKTTQKNEIENFQQVRKLVAKKEKEF
jgi:hypothetical protein